MGYFRDLIYQKWESKKENDNAYMRMYNKNLSCLNNKREAHILTEKQWKEKRGTEKYPTFTQFVQARFRYNNGQKVKASRERNRRTEFDSKENFLI